MNIRTETYYAKGHRSFFVSLIRESCVPNLVANYGDRIEKKGSLDNVGRKRQMYL